MQQGGSSHDPLLLSQPDTLALNVPSHVQPGAPSNGPLNNALNALSNIQLGAQPVVLPDLQLGAAAPNIQQGTLPNATSEFPHGQMNIPQALTHAAPDQWNFIPPWMSYPHNNPYFGIGQNGPGFSNHAYQAQNGAYGYFPPSFPAQFPQGNPWVAAQRLMQAAALTQQSFLPPATLVTVPQQLPDPQSSVSLPNQDVERDA